MRKTEVTLATLGVVAISVASVLLYLSWPENRDSGAIEPATVSIFEGKEESPLKSVAPFNGSPVQVVPEPQTDLTGTNSDPIRDELLLAMGGDFRDIECLWVSRYVEVAGSDEPIEARECIQVNPDLQHPYEEFSSEVLADMAYADPFAALILAIRLAEADADKSWDLMLRSSALLHGRTEPLQWLAYRVYGAVTINGEPVVEALERRYVLELISRQLNGDPIVPLGDAVYANAGFEFSANDLRRLENRTNKVLQEMRRIESEVTGKGRI